MAEFKHFEVIIVSFLTPLGLALFVQVVHSQDALSFLTTFAILQVIALLLLFVYFIRKIYLKDL